MRVCRQAADTHTNCLGGTGRESVNVAQRYGLTRLGMVELVHGVSVWLNLAESWRFVADLQAWQILRYCHDTYKHPEQQRTFKP